ncbi:hypothetical protein [Lentzea sp. NPDC059081]|uniref:hypothetical protein n=1 Tax=Lentzea sp. NPDC059081 TaxID=3346719 RepID=UPI0036915F1C
MTIELDDRASRRLHVTALEKLDNAVCVALANVEAAGTATALDRALADCAETGVVVPQQVRRCVEAAEEHAGYGERMEARMLLTVAHRLLLRR